MSKPDDALERHEAAVRLINHLGECETGFDRIEMMKRALQRARDEERESWENAHKQACYETHPKHSKMRSRENTEPRIKLTKITIEKEGGWYAFGTERQWFEIRVTPTGLIRVGRVNKTKHAVFSVKSDA